MKIGDRVQLRTLRQPRGTIVGVEDGTMLNGAILVDQRFAILWDDNETGIVTEHDVWHIIEPKARFDPFDNSGPPHIVGDESCGVGWCDGGRTYPKRCTCGGWIHAEFGEEYDDDDYFLITQCDQCGESKTS